MSRHELPWFMRDFIWNDAPKPDAQGTFALWLLEKTDKKQVEDKAESSSVTLHTELIKCLEGVHSEADILHALTVLDKIEQASKHILAAFPDHVIRMTWGVLRSEIPKETWNWWESVRDPRKDFSGKPLCLDKKGEKNEHSPLPIAKLKPEMLEFKDCELPGVSTEWGVRFREGFFGGFVAFREEDSKADNAAVEMKKNLFLRTHSILRNVWAVGRTVSNVMAEYYTRECFREDVSLLWRAFGRVLGFTVVESLGVYSSDLNGIGKCGLVLQFPRVPNYVILVQFELELGGPKSMTEFLSTLLAFTSGLNFEDWVWEQGTSPQPTVLPIGLMLSPLGLVRAQYQTHSKRYVCDKHASWDERAYELVFELLSRAACSAHNDEQNDSFELCNSPLPHDTLEQNKRKFAPLLIRVSKQTPCNLWADEEEEEEEEEDQGFGFREEVTAEDSTPDPSFVSLEGEEAEDAEKENRKYCCLPVVSQKELTAEKRVKQWPLNAYFLSQLGKLSREENLERWRNKQTCMC